MIQEWLKDMIYQTDFGVDQENNANNWFFSYKDLKRDLEWTTAECNKRVSWMIDNGYAERNYVESGIVKKLHWRYQYMLTDKGMGLESVLYAIKKMEETK